MAIFTAGSLSNLVARPGMSGGSHEMGETSSKGGHGMESTKLIATKALVGPGGKKDGKSQAGGMAAMAGMASSQDSGDSSGSGSSGGSGDSTTPTTPTTPTTSPAADQSGQQYAAAPNTGVPTSVAAPTAATSTTPTTPADAAATTADKSTDKSADKTGDKPADKTVDKDKTEDKNTDSSSPSHNEEIPAEDQDTILEKIQEINAKDNSMQNILSQSSMDLLFNNFVYFKDFIVQNFTKDKMLSLCIEFINQIYPSEHVKVISMDKSDQPAINNSSDNSGQISDYKKNQSGEQKQSSDQDDAEQQSDQMPQDQTPPVQQMHDQDADQSGQSEEMPQEPAEQNEQPEQEPEESGN